MFYWPPLPYFCLTLAGRTPGRHSNSRRGTACCGPPEGRRPARAPLKGRKSLGNSSPPFTVHDCQVRAARSPGGPKAQHAGSAVLRTAKAQLIQLLQFCEVRPRRAPRAAKASPDSAHSCWARQQFAASGEQQRTPTSCSPRRMAANCAALLAAKARPICFRPQPAENEDEAGAEYFGPPHPGAAGRPLTREFSYSLSAQIPAQPTAPAKPHARPSAAGKPKTVFPPEEQSRPKAQPNSPPRVRLTAAPLSLRHVFARLGKSCQNAQAHFDDFPP